MAAKRPGKSARRPSGKQPAKKRAAAKLAPSKKSTRKAAAPAARGELPPLPPGPPKQSSPHGQAARYSTHKKRARWFNARAAWPHRDAPQTTRMAERERAAANLPPATVTTNWEFIGPSNVGGRMTSVVCDPARPDLIWGGSAGGGVWKSTTGGRDWSPLWHDQPSLNIGALAIDPANPNTLYCGTGEANLSADSYPGVGLYRSTDGGTTWQILAPAASAGIPTRIGTLAVDPFNPGHLRLGGVTHGSGSSDGMFTSRNGGVSWRRESFATSGPYRCHAILFHPAQAGTIFASIDARSTRSGIWKSTDAGGTWQQLTSGLPHPSLMGRTSLAIAHSRPNTVWSLVADAGDKVLGVFRSDDGGSTWRNVAGGHFQREGQMSYGNTIAVHPANPDWVLCGGVDLHLTRDGGAHWQQATQWDARRGTSKYAHADHHQLLMPAAQPGLVYDMNDGGMDVSSDGGLTWANRSNGLACTMFYDLDVSQSDGRMFGGGAQDNGSNLTRSGRPDDFQEVTGGDGGWMLIDPVDPNHLFSTSQNMWVYRYRRLTGWRVVSPPADRAEQEAVWMVFLDMHPTDSRTVYAGGLRVWRTTDDARTWQAVSGILDGSPITAVEVAPADPNAVYIGTENGGFFRSLDGGRTWSGDLAGALPGRTITRLSTPGNAARTVYASVAHFGSSHVFMSNDAGDSWTDIDRGRLPDVPHHAIAISARRPRTLFIANDVGVFVSTDAGGTWNDLSRNLPNVPVVDLVFHDRDQMLLAATYGRSAWRIKPNL